MRRDRNFIVARSERERERERGEERERDGYAKDDDGE